MRYRLAGGRAEFYVTSDAKAVRIPLKPSDAEAAAYDAPFPDARFKAGVRAFPNLVPDGDQAGLWLTKLPPR